MEHCRNSTGSVFRRFAIFYGIFLAILLIFGVTFVRYAFLISECITSASVCILSYTRYLFVDLVVLHLLTRLSSLQLS